MALPSREPGDKRVRIGCVHGCTFDIEGYQTNFPIRRDAGIQRELDYLAIGDTHSFRDVAENLAVPVVYPGAPEPTSFDESGSGSVALVAFFGSGRRPRVESEEVASWRWIDVRCRDMSDLRQLLTMPDLDRRVVRLHLDMTVSLAEGSEVERILRDFRGTDATHGRVGVLLEHSINLQLQVGSDDAFPEDLPHALKDTVARLNRIVADAMDESEKSRATRALSHLFKLLKSHNAPGVRNL
jgi:DNA repair exonuclease SbcCD nuclease subunit